MKKSQELSKEEASSACWKDRKDIRDLVKTWIAFELIVVAFVAYSLGQEGLAKMFCKVTNVDKCVEVFGENY